MMVAIREESEMKEFIVAPGSEFARVGRKGIIFKLSTETLLLTFASDEVSEYYMLIKEMNPDKQHTLLRTPTSLLNLLSKSERTRVRVYSARGRRTRVRASTSSSTVT